MILSLLSEQHKDCPGPHNKPGFGKTPGNTKGSWLVLEKGEWPSDNMSLGKSVVILNHIEKVVRQVQGSSRWGRRKESEARVGGERRKREGLWGKETNKARVAAGKKGGGGMRGT